MTSIIKGKPAAEAEELRKNFMNFMLEENTSESAKSKVGRLLMFEGVKEFPVRVKCATLIWHALEDALKTGGR